jgi:hypothetical protein
MLNSKHALEADSVPNAWLCSGSSVLFWHPSHMAPPLDGILSFAVAIQLANSIASRLPVPAIARSPTAWTDQHPAPRNCLFQMRGRLALFHSLACHDGDRGVWPVGPCRGIAPLSRHGRVLRWLKVTEQRTRVRPRRDQLQIMLLVSPLRCVSWGRSPMSASSPFDGKWAVASHLPTLTHNNQRSLVVTSLPV